MARIKEDYGVDLLRDDMSGSPDNWTTSNLTKNFTGGILTLQDSSASSGYAYNAVSNTDDDWCVEFKWRWTALSTNDPRIIQLRSGATLFSGDKEIGGLSISYADGSISAYDGGSLTDTGVDATQDEWYIIRLYGNNSDETYYVSINGTEYGAYDSNSTISGGKANHVVLGGGGSSSNWTMEYDYLYFKDTLQLVHYTMDDNAANTTVTNEEGTNGVLNGGDDTQDLSVDGVIDTALDFNGADDFIDGNNVGSITGTEMTISAWINPATSQVKYTTPVGKERDSSQNMNYGLQFNVGGTDLTMAFFFYTGTNYGISSSEELPADTWTHVVGRYDNGELDIFFNGVNKGNSSAGSGSMSASSYDLIVGAQKPDTTNRFFDGTLDDIRIYDVALSDDAIVDLFNLGDIPEGATFLPQVMII